MKQQRGMTFISLVMMIAGIVFVAAIGMKLSPAYIEYFSIKKAFVKLQKELKENPDMDKAAIVASFDHQNAIDSFKSVTSNDLVIEQGPSGKVVSVEYSVQTPLAGNVSALIDFSLSTDALQ